jgi:hypothetical protein
VFWETGKFDDPLWLALYLSVLSATVSSIQDSTTKQKDRVLARGGHQIFQSPRTPRTAREMLDHECSCDARPHGIHGT